MKKLISIGLVIFLYLLFSEAFIRIAKTPEERIERYRCTYNKLLESYEPDLGYKMPPNLRIELRGHPDYTYNVETNPLIFTDIGFRDDGLNKEIYAVVIGDSFSWGYGVDNDEIWTEVLEDRLGKDVANLSMPDLSVIQYDILLNKYGLQLKPKVVLIGFYTGNDYRDHASFQEWKDAKTDKGLYVYFWEKHKKENTAKDKIKLKRLNHRLSRFLQEKIATYRFLKTVKFRDIFGSRWKMVKIKEEKVRFDADSILRNLNALETNLFAKGYEVTEEYLKKIKETCTKNSIELYIVSIPTKEEVYCDYLDRIFDFNEEEKARVLRHHSFVKNFCSCNNIGFIDLLPRFRKSANSGEKLYFTHDGHWNKKGHLLAASIVHDFLNHKDPYQVELR